jgi:hypothetical protein
MTTIHQKTEPADLIRAELQPLIYLILVIFTYRDSEKRYFYVKINVYEAGN